MLKNTMSALYLLNPCKDDMNQTGTDIPLGDAKELVIFW